MEETAKSPHYRIDIEGASDHNRSLSVMIAGRRCYLDQQAETEESLQATDPRDHIAQIVQHCADTPDYVLPDTPIKEAMFRIILAAGNEPMTAEEISKGLSGRWAVSAYPRDLSPQVIGRILDNSGSYCIVRLPEPEPAPESKPKAKAAPAPESKPKAKAAPAPEPDPTAEVAPDAGEAAVPTVESDLGTAE